MATNTKRIDIVKKDGKWIAEQNHRKVASGPKKARLIKAVAKTAKSSKRPTSVRIHGKNGRIQEERSYPRALGSPKSKG